MAIGGATNGPERVYQGCCAAGSLLAHPTRMDTRDRNDSSRTPEPDRNVDSNTRDENQHKPEQQRSDKGARGGVPPSKGTDIPATTGAEYAERERGKRTTM